MSDTFRRDHLAAYGDPAPWRRPGHEGEPFIRTPSLDRLAAESALFERFYVSSYPTVPCRYDLLTGRFGFTTRGWQPLERGDVVLPELLSGAGITTMAIFDTPMLATDSYNYTRGFAGWDFVRGQHADRYVVDPIEITLPAPPHKVKAGTRAYLRNAAFRRSENDWMCAQTCTRAMDWLERNRKSDGFFLWIDLWDPHEPFDAPDFDLERYVDPAFEGDRVIYPRYGRADYMTEAERDFVRASYAALVTTVDRWTGRLLEKLDAVGLAENTVVIFLSDHGHLFGDHDLQGKPSGPLGRLYEVTTRVPLLIRHPDGLGAGERIGGIVQHPDLAPTVLELFGLDTPAEMHGRSILGLLRGEWGGREFAVSGRHSPLAAGREPASEAARFDGTAGLQTHGEPITITDATAAYIRPPRGLGEPEGDGSGLHDSLLGFLREHGMPEDQVALYDGEPERAALLPPETELTAPAGLPYAFVDPKEAALCFPERELLTVTLESLDPHALVAVDDQYYRAEDLTPE